MNAPVDQSRWRELTDEELREVVPFTLYVEGLGEDAIERVRAEFRAMMSRAFRRFVHHLGRIPTQAEAEMVAKAVVAYVNSVSIPLLGAPGGAHATVQ